MRLKALEALYPPWQGGDNNDAAAKGLEFSVPPVDVMVDFHGSIDQPALVLYASGNYFFAMKDLVRVFEAANPAYRGKIFYETLPPGLLLDPRFIIPGHGRTSTSAADAITFTRDYIRFLRRAMGDAVGQWTEFDTAYQAVDWSAYRALPAFAASNRGNAYRVFLDIEQESLGDPSEKSRSR